MLFNHKENVVESEKERNFYGKFFAGYLFNELIYGYEKRVAGFISLLEKSEKINYGTEPIVIKYQDLHLTFDLHGYLFEEKSDRGELADIALIDDVDKTCFCIEVKWLEDWTYEKDVKSNHERIKACLSGRYENIFQCLLIKESKWENCKRRYNQSDSNYKLLKDQKDIKLIIIMWEDLIKLVDNESVKGFFSHYLDQKKNDFKQKN